MRTCILDDFKNQQRLLELTKKNPLSIFKTLSPLNGLFLNTSHYFSHVREYIQHFEQSKPTI